ncbi:predicted protein [Uncinocarpus reesii 1704]|uniref:Nascent polypeptide-associated complex subunit alpha-like UBA domain-containing protein n=1 Tax=Uncinocarpus reesii (strain UAMH 1704) TaxID=336963 RepID=C4JG85_UNCRE|nr:uncharacterized protein UREG_02483 [Uncinocarpus reesii 1704]EEP77634.1 predicted protein [Uncinocarpus reesii 1704]
MAEPISTSSQEAKAETASTADDLPANAEDRAAAVALSSLKSTTAAATDDADVQQGTSLPSKADQEALGKAMNRLEALASAAGKAASSDAAGQAATGAGKKEPSAPEKKGEEKAIKKPAIKIKVDDVSLLVEQLDLTKPKAIELLKAHEGDTTKVIRAFILPPTSAG